MAGSTSGVPKEGTDLMPRPGAMIDVPHAVLAETGVNYCYIAFSFLCVNIRLMFFFSVAPQPKNKSKRVLKTEIPGPPPGSRTSNPINPSPDAESNANLSDRREAQ